MSEHCTYRCRKCKKNQVDSKSMTGVCGECLGKTCRKCFSTRNSHLSITGLCVKCLIIQGGYSMEETEKLLSSDKFFKCDCNDRTVIDSINRIRCQKCSEKNNDTDEKSNENVDHPDHYQGRKFEVIDVIEDFDLNFNLGNAIKYILRAGKKNDYKEDLKKAVWYLERETRNDDE